MNRHEFVSNIHVVLDPRTYLEVGVNDGASLTLSKIPSIAIDPAFKVTKEVHCDVELARATSDDFFARENPIAHFGGLPIDFGFIDGMHLFEFALRDFINIEKHARWSSAVVFDDMLPRNVDEAARDRHTKFWMGDVYKLIPVLHKYRPDLLVIPVDSKPTGLLLVLGLDPSNTVLTDNYDEIIADFVVDDPQQIPEPILDRTCAVDPEVVVAASFWQSLAAARGEDSAYPAYPAYTVAELRAEVEQALGIAALPKLADWKPDPSLRPPAPAPAAAAAGGAGAAAGRAATRPADFFSKAARRFPFLRKVPGARAVAKTLR